MGSAFGQGTRSEASFPNKAARVALERYQQADQSRDRLYTGYEYIGYDHRLTGFPFYETDSWKNSSIRLIYKTFDSIPALYDLVKDVLVIDHPAGYRMAMRSELVQSFWLAGHTFVRLTDSTDRTLRTGFYDLLYNGRTQLVARRSKAIVINPSVTITYGVFEPHVQYYVRKEGHYLPVRNKKTLLNVLSDRKKELTAYVRKEKLRFKPDPEPAILALTQYYDELSR